MTPCEMVPLVVVSRWPLMKPEPAAARNVNVEISRCSASMHFCPLDVTAGEVATRARATAYVLSTWVSRARVGGGFRAVDPGAGDRESQACRDQDRHRGLPDELDGPAAR
jgi:hypothetical protein